MFKSINLIYKSIPLFLKGVSMTLQAAFFAMLIGLSIGTILGILNCKKLKLKKLQKFINAYVLVIRGTPVFLQILIAYYVLPDFLGINLPPFVAGVFALGCNSIAYVSEIVKCGINSIPEGQWDASYVLGYGSFSTLKSVILPQMLKNVLPAITNELSALVKETSLLSTIGLLELTKVGTNIIARELDPITIYLSIGFLYFLITTTISFMAKKFEGALQS